MTAHFGEIVQMRTKALKLAQIVFGKTLLKNHFSYSQIQYGGHFKDGFHFWKEI